MVEGTVIFSNYTSKLKNSRSTFHCIDVDEFVIFRGWDDESDKFDDVGHLKNKVAFVRLLMLGAESQQDELVRLWRNL